VAGSVDYELGLARRGLTAEGTLGSFGTKRLLFTWGPKGERPGTFAGGEVYSTDGFGQNRSAQRATAMASTRASSATPARTVSRRPRIRRISTPPAFCGKTTSTRGASASTTAIRDRLSPAKSC